MPSERHDQWHECIKQLGSFQDALETTQSSRAPPLGDPVTSNQTSTKTENLDTQLARGASQDVEATIYRRRVSECLQS